MVLKKIVPEGNHDLNHITLPFSRISQLVELSNHLQEHTADHLDAISKNMLQPRIVSIPTGGRPNCQRTSPSYFHLPNQKY